MVVQRIPRVLLRPGETPAAALARLERRADYARIIGSPEGQALVEAIAVEDRRARKGAVRL